MPLRNYHVYASKARDGYPEADPAYSEENQAAIALSPDRPSGSVIMSIRKAGIVTLDVRDKATGKLVSGLYKLSVPQRWERQGQVSYPLLIHPSTDVMLEVSARGYKTWFYSDASNPSRPLPLRLESGEQKSLRIELEPEERNGSVKRPPRSRKINASSRASLDQLLWDSRELAKSGVLTSLRRLFALSAMKLVKSRFDAKLRQESG